MITNTQTTSLFEIREFLAAQNCAPTPWEKPEGVVERLYAALADKKGDERFWHELKALLARLEDRRFNAQALAGSEALPAATTDEIMDDLRAALGMSDGLRMKRWISRPIGTAAILAFLLLGSAVGCKDSGDDDDTAAAAEADDDDDAYYGNDDDATGDDDAVCQQAQWENFTGKEGQVFCELIDIVEEANIASWAKEILLDCLPELGATVRANLLEQFQTMNDEQIVDKLEDLVDYGGPCYYYYGDDDDH
jgi:hypothetical protein